jgi:OOP family OmpA-OmpF porin
MNRHKRSFQVSVSVSVTVALLSLMVATFAPYSAQAASHPGYVYSADGNTPVRDKDGNCVRTSEWKKEYANKECNPELLPPPPVVAAPAPAPAPAPAVVAAPVVVAVPPAPTHKTITFPEAALFSVNKAELKPEGKEKIKEYREEARDQLSSASSIKITGHTDSTGTPEYNKELSLKRAQAVRDYLVELGADASKMEVVGMGEDQPIADNKTREGRAQNRRVEVDVTGIAK